MKCVLIYLLEISIIDEKVVGCLECGHIGTVSKACLN